MSFSNANSKLSYPTRHFGYARNEYYRKVFLMKQLLKILAHSIKNTSLRITNGPLVLVLNINNIV